MIIWRTKSNNYNVASARYRTVYPAWFIERNFGVGSRFVSGRTSSRMITPARDDKQKAIVFAKHFSRHDIALAKKAKAMGFRIVYDQCDNFFAKHSLSKRDNPQLVASAGELIDAFVFPTDALRDVFTDNGFPADRCHVAPDSMIDGNDELKALAWAGKHMAAFGRIPLMPARHGWHAPLPLSGELDLPANPGKRLVWFGATGSKFGRTGPDLITDIVPELNELSRKLKFDLIMVTSSRDHLASMLSEAKFDWHFIKWSIPAAIAAVKSADVCLLPAGNDAFSNTKSANRVLLAAANGTPVVTNRHPSISGCEQSFRMPETEGSWSIAIEAALADGGNPTRAAFVADILEPVFGGTSIARKWMNILKFDH